MKELEDIYAKYENARAVDVKFTLERDDKDNKRKKEIIAEETKKKQAESQTKQKENAVKGEITSYFKRYFDSKLKDEILVLDQKRAKIDRIRERRARALAKSQSRSKSVPRSKSRSVSAKKAQPKRSPIRLEGSLEDIEESKLESVKEEEESTHKRTNKFKEMVQLKKEENEFTEEEIEKFDYNKEREKLEGCLRNLQNV